MLNHFQILVSLSVITGGKTFDFNQLVNASHFNLKFYKSNDAPVLLLFERDLNPNIIPLKLQLEPRNLQKALVVTIRLLQTSNSSYKLLI